MDKTPLQLAGLIGDRVGLTRPVQTSGWRVPATVQLDGSRIIWRDRDGQREGPMIRVRRGLVEAFIELADADPEAIRDFAQKWGVLWICEHNKPGGHSYPRVSLVDALNGPEKGTWCTPLGWPGECWEPLGAWYRLAREARAMIRVAAALRRQMPAKRGDWHMLVYHTWHGAERGDPALDMLNKPRHAASARAFLEDSVQRWLAWGAVQPVFAWSIKKAPTMEFDGYGLFGALAIELLAAVSGTGWAVCSHCAGWYSPTRRPNPKRRNFCEDCREDGVSHRYAESDRRRRVKGTPITDEGERSMTFIVTLETGEDSYVIAECPALPGCVSQGKTREEALANIREAIQGIMKVRQQHGMPIPVADVVAIEVAA